MEVPNQLNEKNVEMFCRRLVLTVITMFITLSWYQVFSQASKECLLRAEPDNPTLLLQESYPEATVHHAKNFRWDFSQNKTYAYRFFSKSNLHQFSGLIGREASMDSSVSEQGLLIIKSGMGHSAKVMLQNIKQIIEVDNQKIRKNLPRLILFEDMGETGKVTHRLNDSLNTFVYSFLLLPNKLLRVGESFETSLTMPFVDSGIKYLKVARVRFALVKYVTIGTSICAQIKTEISVPESEVIKEKGGQSSFSLEGTAVSFFNVQSNSIVSATAAVQMCSKAQTQAPTTKSSDRVSMVVRSESKINIRYKELL